MSARCQHRDSEFFVHRCEGQPRGAAVHGLVIGTSNYEMLDGKRARGRDRLRDIAGAARGAAQFAQWLAESFNNPDKLPLRTVRLLLAPVAAERESLRDRVAYVDATDENVSVAVEAWYADCDSDRGNVAILYVAGHGVVVSVTGGPVTVFLRGANFRQDRDSQSISVSRIDEAMKYCRARTNIFVFDCCAVRTADVSPEAGVGLRAQTERGEQTRDFQLQVAAARVGQSAYARGADGGTLFSQALIPLLSKAGEIVGDRFSITGHRLGDELAAAVARELVHHKGKQQEPRVTGGHPYGGIHCPVPPPEFKLTVTSATASAAAVQFTISPYGPVENIHQSVLQPGAREVLTLPAAEYLLETRVHAGVRRDKLVVDRDLERELGDDVQ